MSAPSWVHRPPEGHRPRLVHVNATATGGGVAELLHGLVPAQVGSGTSAGWAVIAGDASFFALTKRLYYQLQGMGTSGLPDGELYRSPLREQAAWLAAQLNSGDVVVLHDPQPLGMAPVLAAAGVRVIWHCHIGTDSTQHRLRAEVWRFFEDELQSIGAVVTSRPELAPPQVPPPHRFVLPPAIDLDAPKNRALRDDQIIVLLDGIGLTAHRPATKDAVVEHENLLPAQAPVVLQVSRWDPVKDVIGVLRCFRAMPIEAHLVLAGPDPDEVSDDPDGMRELAAVRAAIKAAPDRSRIHLVTLSMREPVRNALLVNALQRRADVVLQKSLEEGFGLTVTEAMIKGRAVVASNVGGLRTQIEHGRTGLLVDPADDAEVAAAVARLIDNPTFRNELGRKAAAATAGRYLMPRLVADYERLINSMEVVR